MVVIEFHSFYGWDSRNKKQKAALQKYAKRLTRVILKSNVECDAQIYTDDESHSENTREPERNAPEKTHHHKTQEYDAYNKQQNSID